MYDAYERGKADALESVGLEKVALGQVGSKLWRAGRWLHKKLPTKRGIKKGLIGDPKRFAEEIASGRATAKGSLLRESFHTPGAMSKMMFYGFPAVESAGILMDDEGDKSRRVGATLGGAAAGMAAFSPLGMVGSMAADPLGRSIGGAIGQTAGYLGDKVKGYATQPNNELG